LGIFLSKILLGIFAVVKILEGTLDHVHSGGSTEYSRLSRHTSQSVNTSNISLG